MTYTHRQPPRTFDGTTPHVTERQSKIGEHQKALQVFGLRALSVVRDAA